MGIVAWRGVWDQLRQADGGVCDAASAKDAMVEGGTLMAGAIDRIAVRVIAGVVASAGVRRVKGWRAGGHGDGCRAE